MCLLCTRLKNVMSTWTTSQWLSMELFPHSILMFGHWLMETLSRTCQEVVFQRCYFLYYICHLYEAPKEEFPWSLFPLRSCSVLLSSGPCHQSCNWQHSPLYWLLDSRVRFSLTSNKYAGFSQNAFWILNLVSALLNFLLYTYACCSFCFSPCYILYIFVIHRERLGNVLVGMYPIICTLVHEIGW